MFDDNDRKMIKALFQILDEHGSFSLKSREALAFSVVYRWLKQLQEKMNQKEETKVVKKRGRKPKQ